MWAIICYNQINKSTFVRMFMKVMLCEDADWLMSEEAFSIYASYVHHDDNDDVPS